MRWLWWILSSATVVAAAGAPFVLLEKTEQVRIAFEGPAVEELLEFVTVEPGHGIVHPRLRHGPVDQAAAGPLESVEFERGTEAPSDVREGIAHVRGQADHRVVDAALHDGGEPFVVTELVPVQQRGPEAVRLDEPVRRRLLHYAR